MKVIVQDVCRYLYLKPFWKRDTASRSAAQKKAFEEDLKHYLGENWITIQKSEALQNYIDHLQYLEKENPPLLMAYVYHLYLGLPSGGQILAKKRNMFGENFRVPEYKVPDLGTVINTLGLGTRLCKEQGPCVEKRHFNEFEEKSSRLFGVRNGMSKGERIHIRIKGRI